MGDGYNPNEPEHAKYCEVIQIGIDDDTAEVTIFYTPERGQFHFIFSSSFIPTTAKSTSH